MDSEYLQKLNRDLVSQFRQRPRTQVLISAIAKQLDDLRQAQEQLNDLRQISKAEGAQLDGIGDIVVLTRSDAARLALNQSPVSELDDALYRKYLYYKMFLNTSTGTRKEITQILRHFWNEAPLYYSEDPQYPATIFVDTPELAPDVPIDGLLEAPIIKPAGVRFVVRVHTRTDNKRYAYRFVGLSIVKITKTRLSKVEPSIASLKIHTMLEPRWEITRSNLGAFEATGFRNGVGAAGAYEGG